MIMFKKLLRGRLRKIDLEIITGKVVIKDYKLLNDDMDKSIVSLFERYFRNRFIPVKDLLGQYPNQFDKELFKFLNKNKKPSVQDDVFNALSPIFYSYVVLGLYKEAQDFWRRILESVKNWEEKTGKRAHKGSIFYFWAQPAILGGDIDAGFFLVHQAISEDKKTNIRTYRRSPAFKTATLDYLQEDQFLYNFVIQWRDFLKEHLNKYKDLYNKNMTLKEFNKRFLSKLDIIDSVYSFSHALAKVQNFSLKPDVMVENPFASVYELQMLFNMILVIDALIHYRNKSFKKYFYFAKQLIISSNININSSENQTHLEHINERNNIDTDNLIHELIKNELVFPDGYIPTMGERDIFMSYCIRNEVHPIFSTT